MIWSRKYLAQYSARIQRTASTAATRLFQAADRQPVHPDVHSYGPTSQHPHPLLGLVVNIPVVDVSPENGSTEIWPGSHLDTTYNIHQGSARIAEADLERRVRLLHRFNQAECGSVLIRDIRCGTRECPITRSSRAHDCDDSLVQLVDEQ
jgi:hypothetical protein